MTLSTPGIGYTIRGGHGGRERLRLLSRVMADTTLELLDAAGVRRGAVWLDVGCGGGDVSVDALQALIGPAGMAEDTIERLNAALNTALQDAKVRHFFADIGAEAMPGSPDDLQRIARRSSARWAGVVSALGLQIE